MPTDHVHRSGLQPATANSQKPELGTSGQYRSGYRSPQRTAVCERSRKECGWRLADLKPNTAVGLIGCLGRGVQPHDAAPWRRQLRNIGITSARIVKFELEIVAPRQGHLAGAVCWWWVCWAWLVGCSRASSNAICARWSRSNSTRWPNRFAEGLSVRLDMLVAIVEHAAGPSRRSKHFPTLRARKQFVSSMSATRVLFDGTAIVDTEGVVRYNHPPLADGNLPNLADRPYFRRVRDSGRTVISEPVRSRNGLGPTVLVVGTSPRAPQGQVLGYLAAGLRLERGNALGSMAQDALGRTGHFELVTAGPETRCTWCTPTAHVCSSPAPEQARGDLEVPYLTVAKPLRNVDWQLRLVLPQWEADAPLVQADRRLLVDLAAVGLGAGLLAWLGMTWLLRPLGTLRDVMERLRQQPRRPPPILTPAATTSVAISRAHLFR